MCGITGRYDPAGTCTAAELAAQVTRMTATLVHRGPDAEGSWGDGDTGICLGHRRLAVVGLGPGGAQPMVSAEGRWVVSYNGELYNHPGLRRRLEAEGTTFRGGSDTEVLLAALSAWGLDRTLEAVEGMFALALWDRQERTLHLARDRFGEKPLFYGWVGGSFAFGSELKALAALPGFAPGREQSSPVEPRRERPGLQPAVPVNAGHAVLDRPAPAHAALQVNHLEPARARECRQRELDAAARGIRAQGKCAG